MTPSDTSVTSRDTSVTGARGGELFRSTNCTLEVHYVLLKDEPKKAKLHLVTFEAGLGGLSPYAARRLRRKGREAKESGADATDYTASPTARSFVPFYAQLLSAACVLNGARAIQKSIKRRAAQRRSAERVA